jgi:DNA-binding NarL/FixJ family response regulator
MYEERSIRIGIIESNRLFREYLADIINSETDMAVTFTIAAFKQAIALKPADVVLLHWDLIPDDRAFQRSKLIVIDADSFQIDIAQCILSGVKGFVLKDSAIKDLTNAIRTVLSGNWAIPPAVSTNLYGQLAEISNRPTKYRYDARITYRERQIIPLILDGMTNKEIGGKLNIAVDTVKVHVHNILGKLDARGRIDLIKHYNRSRISDDHL